MASDAQSVINGLVTAFQKVLQTHEDQMKKLTGQTSNRRSGLIAGKSLRDLARRQKLREYELKQAEKGLEAAKELDNAFQELTSDLKDNTKNNALSKKKTSDAIARATATSKTLSAQQVNELGTLKGMIDQGKDFSGSMSSISKILDRGLDTEDANYKQKLRALKTEDAYSKVLVSGTEGIKQFVSNIFTAKVALGLFAEGVGREFSVIEESLKHQVPAMDLLRNNFTGLSDTAMRYGLSTKDVMDAQNNFRQTLLATSGSNTDLAASSKNLMQNFHNTGDEFFKVTGTVDGSFQAMAASMNLLNFQGVKMSNDELIKGATGPDGLRAHLQKLSLITGLSYDSLVKMNQEMMQNSDLQYSLLGIDKRRKKGYVDELINRQAYLVSQGMEIDQAKSATEAFAKLTTTVSPKDRYKEAAKLTVLGRSMGINTDGIMGALMHPNAPGSQKVASQFATSMQKALSTGLNSADLRQNMFAGMVQEKAAPGMAMLQGLSTAGMEPRALTPELMKSIDEMTKRTETPLVGLQGTVSKILEWLQKFKNAVSDPSVSILGSAIALVGSGIKDIGKTLIEIWAIQKVLGGEATLLGTAAKLLGGGGAAGTVARLGGMAVGAGGLAGAATAAGGVGLAGVAGYGVGMGINQIPKLFGSDSTFGDMIGSGIYDFFNKKYDPNAKPLMPPTAQQSNSPSDLQQAALTDAINNLTATLTQNNSLTDDQKKLMTDHIKTAKDQLAAIKQNTDATQTNTQLVQTDNQSKMADTDPKASH